MTHLTFVAVSWALTALVFAGLALSIIARNRAAKRRLAQLERAR
ncbi:heme exporter protein CcmD [Roseococcus sp. YIM B11640]